MNNSHRMYEDIIKEMNSQTLFREYRDLHRFRYLESKRGQVSPSITRQIQLVEKEFESRQD